jgi:hypothetical protein
LLQGQAAQSTSGTELLHDVLSVVCSSMTVLWHGRGTQCAVQQWSGRCLGQHLLAGI